MQVSAGDGTLRRHPPRLRTRQRASPDQPPTVATSQARRDAGSEPGSDRGRRGHLPVHRRRRASRRPRT